MKVCKLENISQHLAELASGLRRGELLAYPTDTIYGLGCLADKPGAVARVNAAKGRPSGQPAILLVADLEMAGAWADLSAFGRSLLGRYWPGPNTLLLPSSQLARNYGQGEKIALRLPDLPWLRELIRRAESPLLSTSLNRAGEAPYAELAEAAVWLESLGAGFGIEAGKLPPAAPSAIWDLSDPDNPVKLR